MAAASREGESQVPRSVPERARHRAAPATLAAIAAVLALALALLLAGPARAADGPIAWTPCGAGAECGTLDVPIDHAQPAGPTIAMPVTRVPASDPEHRIGSLVVNYGGPGAPGAEILRDTPPELLPVLAPVVHERFDLVAFDPRGTGGTLPVDCGITPEDGRSTALVTPQTLDVDALLADADRYAALCAERNPGVLDRVSTTDTVRDMDLLRAALGQERLDYLGFSYGSFVGAMYASLFPEHQGRLVLDGALDAQGFVDSPLTDIREQAAGFERALNRFLAACAANQEACSGFGGADPWLAFDALIAAADAAPIPAQIGEPVTGRDITEATAVALYAKEAWPVLALALAEAATGDASLFRVVLDDSAGAGIEDAFVAITALDAAWPREVEPYLEGAREAWRLFDHMWATAGYENVVFGRWPASDPTVFRGPFRSSPSAPPALVVGTTFDPATPYRAAVDLAAGLGNARLLTMRGDGHTAFGSRSSCIDAAVIAYLVDGTEPAEGTVCDQEIPFAPLPPQPPAAEDAALQSLSARLALTRG
jgi:pimeloyl-ACP methyl ester carboxylesterase